MTGSNPTENGPALYVELYDGADPETANKIMGEYIVTLQETNADTGTPFRNSGAMGSSSKFQELNITFGPLQSDTQYWVRVKCLESYSGTSSTSSKKSFTVTSAAGTSEFSSMHPLRTASVHKPADNEVLFQGFDEMTCMYDYINVAVGAFPNYLAAGKTKASMTCSAIQNWTGGYDFSTLLPLSQLAHIGWISQQTKTDDIFTISGGTIATGQPSAGSKIYNFKADCGNIAGWYITNNSYKCAGYVEIGKHYNNDTQQGMLATPKLPEGKLSAAEAKACVCSFKGFVLYGDACDLKIWVYDGASKKWEQKYTVALENSSGTTAKVTTWSAYDPGHKWYEHSCDLDLKAGDIVAFAAPKGSATLLDDICISLK